MVFIIHNYFYTFLFDESEKESIPIFQLQHVAPSLARWQNKFVVGPLGTFVSQELFLHNNSTTHNLLEQIYLQASRTYCL